MRRRAARAFPWLMLFVTAAAHSPWAWVWVAIILLGAVVGALSSIARNDDEEVRDGDR